MQPLRVRSSSRGSAPSSARPVLLASQRTKHLAGRHATSASRLFARTAGRSSGTIPNVHNRLTRCFTGYQSCASWFGGTYCTFEVQFECSWPSRAREALPLRNEPRQITCRDFALEHSYCSNAHSCTCLSQLSLPSRDGAAPGAHGITIIFHLYQIPTRIMRCFCGNCLRPNPTALLLLGTF